MEFGEAVGTVLRDLRKDRKLTLHGVQELSDGSFKASALSGYERGERSISLERFYELTALYGMAPDTALTRVRSLMGEHNSSVIDLTENTIDLAERREARQDS